MKITIYTKTRCPWSADIMAFLTLNKIPFTEKDMRLKEVYKNECIGKTGQWKSPTVEIDGKIFPDTDINQVAEYLKKIGVIEKSKLYEKSGDSQIEKRNVCI